jgi:hypothetical protein
MIATIIALQQFGYEVQVDSDHLRLRWRGEGNPPRDRVVLLLQEVRRRKAEVLAALTTPQMTSGSPAVSPSTMTANSGSTAVADPVEPSSPTVQPAGGDPAPAEDVEGCGWCGSTRLWHADTGSGRIYCEACHAVYHPAQGRWAAGERAKQQLVVA